MNQTFKDFEIIIVDDGSTDELTRNLLNNYKKPQTKVIRTTNQGLSRARNNGIKIARGKYILPLDADDKIAPTYLEKAVSILDKNPDVGIVYCKAELFDAKKGLWELPSFSLRKMLVRNVIFCSALYRKNDWKITGGYKPSMIHGWEDWDFWLSILEIKRTVFQIPEVLFYYRIHSDSMVSSLDKHKRINMHMQLIQNHKELYITRMEPLVTIFYNITMNPIYMFLNRKIKQMKRMKTLMLEIFFKKRHND
jgi:glycosyltransferase involved in cell wall biosynthesis